MTILDCRLANRNVSTKNGLEVLSKYNKKDFLYIHFLLQIFCTLFISTATVERDFQP